MIRPLPLVAFCMYLVEKHTKEVFVEDCAWLHATSVLDEKNRHHLMRPYERHIKINQIEQHNDIPHKTREETMNFIFEGV